MELAFSTYVCSREGDHSTTIFSGEADTGNMCWAAIAMARAYHYMGRPHYLHGARTVADWVIKHTTVGYETSSFRCISCPWSLALSLLSSHNMFKTMRLSKLCLYQASLLHLRGTSGVLTLGIIGIKLRCLCSLETWRLVY